MKLNQIKGLRLFFLTLPILTLALIPNEAQSTASGIHYELAITFNLHDQSLSGTAHLNIPPGKGIEVSLRSLRATGIVLNRDGYPPAGVQANNTELIHIPPEAFRQDLFISYTKQINQSRDNFINDKGITLLHDWYPRPSENVLFSVSAALPEGFWAVTESDFLPTRPGDKANFSFSKPTNTIHFVSAPFIVNSIKLDNGVVVRTYFSKENSNLSKDYLEAAAKYFALYEEMIGPYPYNHFAIVENTRPTGYGMATFTLLGKAVIRLPFIKETSLGHEILHSWFGNSIYVKEDSGNWAEGLTSYLADWHYREQKGEGVNNRKENIVKYLNSVSNSNSISLGSFRSASHSQEKADAVRSVGYIRGAMFFHELKKYVGEAAFSQGISSFYRNFRDKAAGWDDIRSVFEGISGYPLKTFFSTRLNAKDIVDLSLKDAAVESLGPVYKITLTLRQNNPTVFHFQIPILVITATGAATHFVKTASAEQKVELISDLPPLKIILDPDYDLLRTMGEDEKTPAWSAIMGAEDVTVIVTGTDRKKYASILDIYSKKNWKIHSPEEVANSELGKTNLIFLGIENSVVFSLFGKKTDINKGLKLDIDYNPLNKRHFALLLSASSAEEADLAAMKLRHYGRYSMLRFISGSIQGKRIATSTMGMQLQLSTAPKALPSNQLADLKDTISSLLKKDVIYIGESHTSMTDHDLQLLIIQALYKEDSNLAIGMEMFPRGSQSVLDQYTLQKSITDEREFLKKSEYFKVWRYDYRLYKKIIDFAKTNSIRLIAMNIDRDIVSNVFRNGTTDQLSEEQKKKLPNFRDLSIPGYYERLTASHGHHIQGGHATGKLGGFLQAQALWDESMAESILEYLSSNPESKLIVLAGSQHTRKDNGIPPRVSSRRDIDSVVIESLGERSAPNDKTADYFFILDETSLPPAGKIGIGLEEVAEKESAYLRIISLSPHSKAKESGLKTGDKVLSINGFPTKTMEDIKIAMVGQLAGSKVAVQVERSETVEQNVKHTFSVELYNPPADYN